MRLVCPNCGAQYEVDDRVMPENGRDVQCSNCGHAWFQFPPSAEAKETDTTSPFDDVEGTDGDETQVQETEDIQEPSAPETIGESDSDDDGSKPPEKSARTLDEGVRNILQEEAAQEIQARKAERENIETQTDLGLDDAPKAKPDLGAVESDPQIEEASVEADDLKGRDVLPDIEEINSTLDAPEGEAEISIADDAVAAAKSGGFRRGFVIVVVLACLLAILYIFAPAIGERIPALQPVLEKYIVVADQVRVALEDTMRNAISKMQGLIDKPENG